MTISVRQTLTYILLAIATTILTVIVYYNFNQDWINYKKGEDFFKKKNFAEAIHYYQIAVDKGLPYPTVYLHMGDANTAEGNFQEAIRLYRIYLTLKPKDKTGRLALARALSYVKDYKSSEEEYKKLVEDKNDAL